MGAVALLVDPSAGTAPATFTAVIVNGGQRRLTYGAPYTIEYWDGATWQQTDLAPEIFIDIAFILEPGGIGQPETVEIPAEVQSGFYRVAKVASEEGGDTGLKLYGLFQIL